MSDHKPLNRAQRVLALLTARYPRWVPAIELEAPGGRQAWRTAVSEARQIAKAAGGNIENRTRWMFSEALTWTLSEYRYVPADRASVGRPQGHDVNLASPGSLF